MSESQSPSPGKSYWIISIVALVWNVLGIVTYLLTVTMSEDVMAAMSEAERGLYADTPAWAVGAYAIAVFAGTAGSLGLVLRKGWAIPLLALSLVGILGQMGQALLGTAVLEVNGPGAAVMPVVIIAIAAFLFWYARGAKAKGILR